VEKGYAQKEGIGYEKTFSPIKTHQNMFPTCLLDNRDADFFVFFHIFRVKLTFIRE
jgi:hypothetical protein